MKKWLCAILMMAAMLCAVAVAGADVAIDEINFPDDNFRSYVAGFDTDGNGSFSEEELGRVTYIYCNSMNIADLTGVEHFYALTTLYCSFNQLFYLDMRNNSALTKLDCGFNQVSELDLRYNSALTYLCCRNNALRELDLSCNTILSSLNCMNNQLTELDVSNNNALTELFCNGNQLNTLNVSQNILLQMLSCGGNQLTELDVSHNSMLTYLDFNSNKLTELDVSHNDKLVGLSFGFNFITEFDVRNNNMLESISCDNNYITQIDIKNNTALKELTCSNNQISALDVSSNTELTYLCCYGNPIGTLDISYTPNLFNAILNGTRQSFYYIDTYEYGACQIKIDSDVTLFMVPSLYIFLPTDLTVIENEAFLNIEADAVIISPTVTSIGENAFPTGTRIYSIASSPSRTWAIRNNCLFFPCTQEWLDALQ